MKPSVILPVPHLQITKRGRSFCPRRLFFRACSWAVFVAIFLILFCTTSQISRLRGPGVHRGNESAVGDRRMSSTEPSGSVSSKDRNDHRVFLTARSVGGPRGRHYMKTRPRSFRIEPLLVKNPTPIHTNMMEKMNYRKAKRISDIIQSLSDNIVYLKEKTPDVLPKMKLLLESETLFSSSTPLSSSDKQSVPTAHSSQPLTQFRSEMARQCMSNTAVSKFITNSSSGDSVTYKNNCDINSTDASLPSLTAAFMVADVISENLSHNLESLYSAEGFWNQTTDSGSRIHPQMSHSFPSKSTPYKAVVSQASLHSFLPVNVSMNSKMRMENSHSCDVIPPNLEGRLIVNVTILETVNPSEVLRENKWVLPGGYWSPALDPLHPCLPRHQVAIIIPYRDRQEHLTIFISQIHPLLRKQQLEYTLFVVEQTGKSTFNKGLVMNAGFLEAWKMTAASCFIFHDVDLLPEDDRNMYSCPSQPRHLSVAVDTFHYILPYKHLVGGVLNMRGEHFFRVNGYSNLYWGWGGEDDDMSNRIKRSGLTLTRPPAAIARYTMMKHTKRRQITWKVLSLLLKSSGARFRSDGLNTVRYKLVSKMAHPLFTHLLVDVGEPPKAMLYLLKQRRSPSG